MQQRDYGAAGPTDKSVHTKLELEAAHQRYENRLLMGVEDWGLGWRLSP
jgi:hypothetical protein